MMRKLLAVLCLLIAGPAAGQTLDGTVYRDYNADGIKGEREPGIAEIQIDVFAATGANVGSASTIADGTYTMALSVGAGTAVRVEVSNLPGFLEPGPFGPASGTTVFFAQSGDSGLDVGLNNPGQYCTDLTDLGTACFTSGPQTSASEAIIVSFPETAGADDGSDASLYDLPAYTQEAVENQIGAVWGLAYRAESDTIYAGSFVKRHANIGPSGNPTTLYAIDRGTGTVSTWLTLDPTRLNPHAATVDWDQDFDAFDSVFQDGLGDVDISEDGDTLYTIDLGLRNFIAIAIQPDGSPGAVTTVPIVPAVEAAMDAGGCPDSLADTKPFGIGIRDGVVYIGVVCSAGSTVAEGELPIEGIEPGSSPEPVLRPGEPSEMRGHVFAWDGAMGFDEVLSFPLAYLRGCATDNRRPTCIDAQGGFWQTWVDQYPFYDSIDNTTGLSHGEHRGVYPQPILSDIEFDNGDMILGLADRWAHQTGPNSVSPPYPQNDPPETNGTLALTFGAGDLLRACTNGTGSWLIEESIEPANTSCGTIGMSLNSDAPFLFSIDEYYYQEDFSATQRQHAEVTEGGIAQIAGREDVFVGAFDPVYPINSETFDGGLIWLNNDDGTWVKSYRLYNQNAAGNPTTFFGKAAGIGDVVPLCPPAPIEIGNRVWLDDGDGLQDPGEPGLDGVTVRLICGGSEIAVTTTSDLAGTADAGTYLFNDDNVAGGVPRHTACEVRLDPADAALTGLLATAANNTGNDLNDSDGVMIDGSIAASFMTADVGANNHTYDFGFILGPTDDFGDAPDPTYPTLATSNGARHTVDGATFLGASVDVELDGQPTPAADGDDSTGGSDDEDGVTFTSLLVPGNNATVAVVASVDGVLNAWKDWNGDGDWNDLGERIFTDEPLTAGLNNLTFAVPAGVNEGTTYARFRFTSLAGTGGGAPTGAASDGEVEDHLCSVERALDYGDAPDPTYPTLGASNGARHVIDGTTFLGATVDAEVDGQPTANADGDDNTDANDDEDGVTFTSLLQPGGLATVDVVASVAGVLNAWKDWNGDGDWNDAGERIFTDVALTAGLNSLSFAVPLAANAGTTYARFRFTSFAGTGGGSPTGEASDGEIEDHICDVGAGLDFGDAPDPAYPTLLASNGARHIILASNPTLGSVVDIEADGQPSADHLGDDSGALDDEDGVLMPAGFVAGTSLELEVTATISGLLNAWIDFNGNGTYGDEAGEQIASDLALAAGLNLVPVSIPGTAVPGSTSARFRYSTQAGLGPMGLAADGEVEDYAAEIVAPAPLIGLAKDLITLVDLGDGTFELLLEMLVENYGDTALDNLQVTSSLATALADAASWSVISVTPSANLTTNPGFDGDTDIDLLSGVDSLAAGETGVIELALQVAPGDNPGPYLCSATASADGVDDTPVDDDSQDGDDPDPDGDGDPTNNDEPTEIVFEIVAVDIPTLGEWGLMLFAAGLLGLGLTILRRRARV